MSGHDQKDIAKAAKPDDVEVDVLKKRSNKKVYFLAYYAAIVTLILYYQSHDKDKLSPFHRTAWTSTDIHLAAVAILGFLGDLPVLRWHASNPVHAKFLLNPKRKIVLAIHIAAGLIEIFTQFAAFFSPPHHTMYWSNLAVAVALFAHIPSAIFQTPNVFGVKSLTIPFYVVFIYMHIHASIGLLRHPTSPEYILKHFVALHGYAWVRIVIFWFEVTYSLQAHMYTVAIFFAGFLTCPPVLGEAANFAFIMAVLCFQLILFVSHYLSPRFLYSILGFGPAGIHPMTTIEFSRRGLGVLPEVLIRAAVEMELILEDHNPVSPKESSRLMDREKTKKRRESIQKSVGFAFEGEPTLKRFDSTKAFQFDPPVVKRRSSYLGESRLTQLATSVARLEALDDNVSEIVALIDDVFGRARKLSKEERAKVVFHMFAGPNGDISMEVLAAVLVFWTVPMSDVKALMDTYGNKRGCIDLQTWTEHLDTIYDYVIYMMCDFKSITYFESRSQNVGTDKCPIHAIKAVLSVPNALLLDE